MISMRILTQNHSETCVTTIEQNHLGRGFCHRHLNRNEPRTFKTSRLIPLAPVPTSPAFLACNRRTPDHMYACVYEHIAARVRASMHACAHACLSGHLLVRAQNNLNNMCTRTRMLAGRRVRSCRGACFRCALLQRCALARTLCVGGSTSRLFGACACVRTDVCACVHAGVRAHARRAYTVGFEKSASEGSVLANHRNTLAVLPCKNIN